jgi:hypothetical protein
MVGSAGAAPTKVAAGHNGECGWQPIGVGATKNATYRQLVDG